MVGYPKTGLILSGGGARGAYQAGVLVALYEIAEEAGLENPFPVITGVSAGAINSAFLASLAHEGRNSAHRLADLWRALTAERVFKTDAVTAGRSGLRLLADAAVGALYSKKLAKSLLDTEPLWNTIHEEIEFNRIGRNIEDRHLEAVGVTAMNYSTGISETFVEARDGVAMWERSRRHGVRVQLAAHHIMASSAIPLFFPPVSIGNHHFGDGCLRNTAPISPALHLGADQVLVISVRRPDHLAPPPAQNLEPSFARVLGVILNALLLDAIDVDMERLIRMNGTLDHLPSAKQNELDLKRVEWHWLRPTQDIGHLASDLYDDLPRVIRYLLGGLGSSRESSELTSYLLFSPGFCSKLVDIGYSDGMAQKQEIKAFLLGQKPIVQARLVVS